VLPIDETSIPAFDGDMDYYYDVDGKGLPLFAADSAHLLDEQEVATLAFGKSDLLSDEVLQVSSKAIDRPLGSSALGRWLCKLRTPHS
jgi:hypothetical protein